MRPERTTCPWRPRTRPASTPQAAPRNPRAPALRALPPPLPDRQAHRSPAGGGQGCPAELSRAASWGRQGQQDTPPLTWGTAGPAQGGLASHRPRDGGCGGDGRAATAGAALAETGVREPEWGPQGARGPGGPAPAPPPAPGEAEHPLALSGTVLTSSSCCQRRARGRASRRPWSACARRPSARPAAGPGWSPRCGGQARAAS